MRYNMTEIYCSGTAYQTSAVVTPSQSSSQYFHTNQLDTDTVLVRVSSLNQSDDLCTLISIQDPLCPPKKSLGEAMR